MFGRDSDRPKGEGPIRLPVVFGADRAFAMPLAVSIASLARAARPTDDLEIHIIASDPDATLRELVERAATGASRIQWHAVDADTFSELPSAPGISAATYYRLLIPTLVDQERVLYLDSDILVRRSIAPLFSISLEGRPAAAVRNLTIPFVASPQGVSGWMDLHLQPSAPYFNAGVLLMDLPLWNELSVTERALDYLARFHERVRLADQEALNAVLCDHWYELDATWNQQPLIHDDWSGAHAIIGTDAVISARDDPHIVHFVGPFKPWHVGSTRPWTAEWVRTAKALDEDWAPRRRRTRFEELKWRLRRSSHVLMRGR